MATTTPTTSHRPSSPTPVPTTPPTPLTPQQTELLKRTECYLKLEEAAESQAVAVEKRRGDEEDKLLKALCALPDPAANNALLAQLKTFETVATSIATDEQQVNRFRKLVRSRIDTLVEQQGWVVKLALEAQLKDLMEKQGREQKDVEAVSKQIDEVRARLEMLCKLEEQSSAQQSTKSK